MAIRILTKNGIENTNIDGARDNNFNAGGKSGIVKGALNEGNLYGTSNSLTLEPCELRLCGHRIVIDENENRAFTNKPQTATEQSLIAQIQVDGENVTFELIVQNSSTALVQDNLDINGNGTYQLEIGTFTQNTDGTISDVVRTAELISGSFDINMVENKANKDLSNVTVNIEKTELLYDKSSSDSNINWGYTGGIQDNVQVTGKDFAKYKGLYAFVRFFGETHKIYVDLTQLTQNNEYCSASTNITKNFDGYDSAMIVVNSNKSTLVPYFRYGFSSFNVGSSTEFFIYKIEGVY